MKKIFNLSLVLILFLAANITTQAATISGTVLDAATDEPLIGVYVTIQNTTTGTITDFDGVYYLENLADGNYKLEISYMSYITINSETINISSGKDIVADFKMKEDSKQLETFVVQGKINRESSVALYNQRNASTVAVENIGAQEMSKKGLSNAGETVTKMTGISMADEGQLIVRGLGDRYSSTALNTLPIASPNPDNKLVPLELFSSSVIKAITVKKVYDVRNYADYSGAYIDIETKESVGERFFNVSANIGGEFATFGQQYYTSDKKHGLWSSNLIDQSIIDMGYKEFNDYYKNNDIFGTTFQIHNSLMVLPDFGITMSYGEDFHIGNETTLGVLASVNLKNKNAIVEDTYDATYSAQGYILSEFQSQNYASELNISALANLGLNFLGTNNISYTFLYARSAEDDYKLRTGIDEENNNLVGSNSIMHVYQLINNQLKGKHELTENWELLWGASYGLTNSDEPDRRQVMYSLTADKKLELFTLNQQETMRYNGVLKENEGAANINFQYTVGKRDNVLEFGGAYKNKQRDFRSARFYYNLSNLDIVLNDINEVYNPNSYLNQENLSNGTIKLKKDNQPNYNYFAGQDIGGGFVDFTWNAMDKLVVEAGLRVEYSNTWVKYWNDASIAKTSTLSSVDFFPAANLKYTVNDKNNFRFAFSRTITRPGFIEMAPFLYKESYGGDEIRGNENLQNGFNYNIDFKYDYNFGHKADYLSVTAYFKYLDNPIERVQEVAGGSMVNTFMNTTSGLAAGVEFEIRKELFKNFNLGLNLSLMYTDVTLPENGVYTDQNRNLQGASPYLGNADISYDLFLGLNKEQKMQFVLLYNLQGPRIHAVGINGVENTIQHSVHSLNFIYNYKPTKNWTVFLKLKDMLNLDTRYTQRIIDTKQDVLVKSSKVGIGIEVGCKFNL